MKYHEIGEKFEFDGVVLEVMKGDGQSDCNYCYMWQRHCKTGGTMYCGKKTRADNQPTYYKLVEQCKPKDMEQKNRNHCRGYGQSVCNQVTGIHSDEEIYGSLLDKLFATYKSKNADYGSAFAEMFDELGIDYAYGKLREKMNRIKVLRKQPNMVENEGLEDALLDTAGYAILTLVELKKRKK